MIWKHRLLFYEFIFKYVTLKFIDVCVFVCVYIAVQVYKCIFVYALRGQLSSFSLLLLSTSLLEARCLMELQLMHSAKVTIQEIQGIQIILLP